MIYLILSISCSVIIANLLKLVDQKNLSIFSIFAVNYFIAALVAGCGSRSLSALAQVRIEVILLGLLLGTLFITTLFLFLFTIQKLGIALPVSLMRLSAVIPTLGSVFFFFERPTFFQMIGITLTFFALPLASRERITLSTWQRLFHHGFGWGIVLFVTYGICDFLLKVQTELYPLENTYHLMFYIFGTAFIISLGIVIGQRAKFTVPIVGLGTILGVVNLFSTFFLVKALHNLPGILVYPANGIGVIVLSALTGFVIWKEMLEKHNYVFLILAGIALVLLY